MCTHQPLKNREFLNRDLSPFEGKGLKFQIFDEGTTRDSGNKAMKLLSELENEAGLIVRKRQGQGKPNRIYVKNFIADPDLDPESSKSRFKELQDQDSRNVETTIQETSKSRGNNTEMKKTDLSDTDSINPIRDGYDETEYREATKRYFHATLDFDTLLQDEPAERETLEGILSLLVDICCSKKENIRVGRELFIKFTGLPPTY